MTRFILWIIGCAWLIGCSPSGSKYQQTGASLLPFELRRASVEPVDGWEPAASLNAAIDGAPLFLSPTLEITNDDLRSTGVERGSDGNWVVVLTLNEPAKARFGELSKAMAHAATRRERLALIVDGEIVVAPIVTAPMTDGLIPFSGPFSEDEARRIAKGIVGR